MLQHLRYSLMKASIDCGENRHAQEVMQELGISYQHSTPQSMGVQWWFWNCDNVPDTLPPYLTPLCLDPMEQIGYGLTREKAEKIRDKVPAEKHRGVFHSLEAFKKQAEYFPAGKIIPRRIIRCSNRKFQHVVYFAVDSWALRYHGGYILAMSSSGVKKEVNRRSHSLMKGVVLQGSPYGGKLNFVFLEENVSDWEHLCAINHVLLK